MASSNLSGGSGSDQMGSGNESDSLGGAGSAKGPAANGSNSSGFGYKKPGPTPQIPSDSVHHDGNVPDGSPASLPPPIDLSLLSGPTQTPQRRPLTNVALGGQYAQAGITGYAGVFVP